MATFDVLQLFVFVYLCICVFVYLYFYICVFVCLLVLPVVVGCSKLLGRDHFLLRARYFPNTAITFVIIGARFKKALLVRVVLLVPQLRPPQ